MLMLSAAGPVIVRVVSPESGLTEAVAFAGLVLAAVSLGWQALTFQLSGSRVRVQMRVGTSNHGGVAEWTDPGFPDLQWFPRLAQQGFGEPLLIATIRNVGRMTVTVESCVWHSEDVSLSLLQIPPSQPLPHRLEPHDKCIAVVTLRSVVAMIEATNGVFGTTNRDAWPEVKLGNDKTVRGNRITMPEGILELLP